MYFGKPLHTPSNAAAAMLASAATNRRLTLYAGAGISMASPSNLPGAAGLAGRLVAELEHDFDFSSIDNTDLLAVADLAASRPNGLQLLKDAIARSAPFATATHTYAHAVLALLVLEGAATVLVVNYDDCIERAGMPESVPVVITTHDRHDSSPTALLKAHGSIARRSSMLITTDELASPPLYARAELLVRLTLGPIAFVGLGSPSDYVKESISAFVTALPDRDDIVLADPGIADWSTSDWSTILPTLPVEKRVAEFADPFTDALLRCYVEKQFVDAQLLVSGLSDAHAQRVGWDVLAEALRSRDAVWVLRWFRGSLVQANPGDASIGAPSVLNAILAVGALAARSDLTVLPCGWSQLEVGSQRIFVLALVTLSVRRGGDMEAEALRRVYEARSAGQIVAGAAVIVVCSGHSGALGADEVLPTSRAESAQSIATRLAPGVPTNLIADPDEAHLVDGFMAGAVSLVSAGNLVAA